MISSKEFKSIVMVAFCTFTALFFLNRLEFFKISHYHIQTPHHHSPTKLVERNSRIPNRPTEPKTISSVVQAKAVILPLQHAVEKVKNPESLSISTTKLSELNGESLDIKCPASVNQLYSAPDATSTFETDLKWCKETIKRDGVVIGRSWGRMNKNSQMRWDKIKCNEILSRGKLQTCDERWGWSSFTDWLSNSKNIVRGASNVTCVANVKTSTFCQYGNTVVDFSKMSAGSGTRRFEEGFITTFGNQISFTGYPHYPGLKHVTLEGAALTNFQPAGHCDEVEERPAFVLSNDDIFNLGHYFNDVMGVWNMFVLANKAPKSALLINIDGFRPGGPAGGPPHRLMVPSAPDTHGPFNGYFSSWFGEVKKGVEFGQRRVCFKEIYFPPLPGVPWFWNDWGQINDCSTQAASPLYQSFNRFLRDSWVEKHGPGSLVDPPTDHVHIVIEVRSINKAKRNNHSAARHITNLAELVAALESIPGVKVTAQDFALLSFEKQVSLSHSASVFMSMHGAGTTHIFHSAVGKPNCCALVELFPDTTIEFHHAHGYGNIARMLGLHHFRAVAPDGATHQAGTAVDIPKIKLLAEQAVEAVRAKPTCLHDYRDTSKGIYKENSVFVPVM